MNIVRTNIKVDIDTLYREYQIMLESHTERYLGIDTEVPSGVDIDDTISKEKYCFRGSWAHGTRFHSTRELTQEEERAVSSNSEEGAKIDHLFTRRNEKCVGYLNDVLDFLSDAWRGSWWTLDPGFCYKPHSDSPYDSMRCHIALTTNPFCHMAYDDGECHHIPADGHIYLSRTDIKHTAWNMGESSRTHIMMKMPLQSWNRYANHSLYSI